MQRNQFITRDELPNLTHIFGNVGQSWNNALPNDLFIKGVPKNILNSSTKTGNVGTGLDPLRSFSLLAGSLRANNDLLHFWFGGAFGINNDDKRLQVSFGGNVLLNTGQLDLDNHGWFLEGIIIRLSDTTFNFILNSNLGQILSDSVPVLSSTGSLVTARTGNAVTLSGATTFSGSNQTLLIEAESFVAVNDNITHDIAKIELTRF